MSSPHREIQNPTPYNRILKLDIINTVKRLFFPCAVMVRNALTDPCKKSIILVGKMCETTRLVLGMQNNTINKTNIVHTDKVIKNPYRVLNTT